MLIYLVGLLVCQLLLCWIAYWQPTVRNKKTKIPWYCFLIISTMWPILVTLIILYTVYERCSNSEPTVYVYEPPEDKE